MLGELIVGIVLLIGFVIGARIWWRCERYLRSGKPIVMILCAVVALICGRLSGLLLEDLRDDQVLTGLLLIGGLSAVVGVVFCEGFLRLWSLYRKMKEGSKDQ
jgi:hypothetical protein